MKRLLSVVLMLLPGAAFADIEGYDHMAGWGYGMGMMFGPVLWLVVLGLVVAGVVWFLRGSGPAGTGPDAKAELDLRLARGEIDVEDYTARKALLGK